jgi:hypothetical protein
MNESVLPSRNAAKTRRIWHSDALGALPLLRNLREAAAAQIKQTQTPRLTLIVSLDKMWPCLQVIFWEFIIRIAFPVNGTAGIAVPTAIRIPERA